MLKKIVWGIVGSLIVLGATMAMPPTKVEAVETETALTPSETASLNQALEALRITLALMQVRISALNLSADQAKQINIALQGIRTSLTILDTNLKSSELALTEPKESGTVESSVFTVVGNQPAPKEKPAVTVVGSEEKSLTALTPAIEEGGTEMALAEAAETTGGGAWKNVFWITVAAVVIGWVVYSQVWKKRLAPQSQSANTT